MNMTMNMNLKIGCALALAAALFAGCKQPPKSASVDPAGSYSLVSVNGKNVPCVVEHGGREMTVKSGQFIIAASGEITSKTVFALAGGTDVTREVKATYEQEGSKLTMKWKKAGTTTGALEGNTFTMNNEGMIFAYRK